MHFNAVNFYIILSIHKHLLTKMEVPATLLQARIPESDFVTTKDLYTRCNRKHREQHQE